MGTVENRLPPKNKIISAIYRKLHARALRDDVKQNWAMRALRRRRRFRPRDRRAGSVAARDQGWQRTFACFDTPAEVAEDVKQIWHHARSWWVPWYRLAALESGAARGGRGTPEPDARPRSLTPRRQLGSTRRRRGWRWSRWRCDRYRACSTLRRRQTPSTPTARFSRFGRASAAGIRHRERQGASRRRSPAAEGRDTLQRYGRSRCAGPPQAALALGRVMERSCPRPIVRPNSCDTPSAFGRRAVQVGGTESAAQQTRFGRVTDLFMVDRPTKILLYAIGLRTTCQKHASD
jgi:hypothetical protein